MSTLPAAIPALNRGTAPGATVPAAAIAVTVLFLVTVFFRLPIKEMLGGIPVEVFWAVFAGLVGVTLLWVDRTTSRVRGFGAIEWAMVVYLIWNVYSMVAPHEYPSGSPLDTVGLPIPRFIFVGTLIPFALYVIGRFIFDRDMTVRALLWVILELASYSAAVSIMPYIGLSDLVWPRYIVTEVRPSWAGRAVGIFNQPVANGMILGLGVAIATVLAARRGEPIWQRRLAIIVAAACGFGLYLTHTRACWLGGVVVLLIGAVLGRGYRRGFITVLFAMAAVVAFNWSVFTSADRDAGGVGSIDEVQSRLNDMRTAMWAATQKPLDGWGIGRFQSVNVYHHQQWSPDVPWMAGMGEVSHENQLAILAELGAIGLLAWISVLAFIGHRLWHAYRVLPDGELCGKPLVVIAIMALAVLLCAGMTVDLRFLDFPTATIFLLLGVAIGWSDRKTGVSP